MKRCIDCIHFKACEDWASNFSCYVECTFPYEAEDNLCDYFEPVVHGEWEFVGQDDNDMPIYRCPMCGRKQFGRSTYCGDCGNRLIWDGGNSNG